MEVECEGAAEVGAAEVFGAVEAALCTADGWELAVAEGGEEGGDVKSGVDGIAGLRVGERKREGVAGGDADAGAGEGDTGGGEIAEIE